MSADCLHVCLHDLACKAHAYYNHLFHVAFYENLKDCHHTRLYVYILFAILFSQLQAWASLSGNKRHPSAVCLQSESHRFYLWPIWNR